MLLLLPFFVTFFPNAHGGQENFFAYGIHAGDSKLAQGNDEFQEVILTEDAAFPFYGGRYNRIYINTNGLITFERPWPTPQTGRYLNSLPLHPDLNEDGILDNITFAAPFWADIDTSRNRGLIHYRSTNSSIDLKRASNEVRTNFPDYPDYTPNQAVVVTWVNVSFNNETKSLTDPRNTFQGVLITDGVDSFVFFLYDKIEWTAGTTLSGNPSTGIPEKDIYQAIVGFNKGDGQESCDEGIPESRMDLPLNSNINQMGIYAFQVNDEINPGNCSKEASRFVTYPRFGSILGGEKITFYGTCWDRNNKAQVMCQFWNEAVEPSVLLQTVKGFFEDQTTTYCVPEPFFLVGEVTVKVSFDGGVSYNKSGVYQILNLDRISVSEKISRVDADSLIWHTAGQDLDITWPTDVYPANTMVDIHILNYQEDGAMGPRWEKAYTIATRVKNTGSIQFRTYGLDNMTAENGFGVIRIQPSGDKIGVKLYSDIHPLGYLLEESYQSDPKRWAADQCRLWVKREDQGKHLVQNLESCPCTLDQALADKTRFYSDHSCNMLNNNKCPMNKGSKHCVMSIFPNAHNTGSKCCYDNGGNLMYTGDSPYGSTSQRVHMAGSFPYMEAGSVPTLSHYKHDIVPHFFCCLMGGGCRSYLNRRPTADCYYYESPKAAISFGATHFITFDGSNYTFNGFGDYSLLHVGGSYNFKLEGRFEAIETRDQPHGQEGVSVATGLTAAVMFEDNTNCIQVLRSNIRGIEIYRGQCNKDTMTIFRWDAVDFRRQIWLDYPGVAVSINDVTDNSRVTSITVMFRNSGIAINVTRGIHDSSFLTITPLLPPKLMNDNTVTGLFGNWNGNTNDDFMDASGQFLNLNKARPEEIYKFADSWRTTTDGLFFETGATRRRDDTVYTPVLLPPELSALTSAERTILNQICSSNEQCSYDYLVTRNQELASDTKAAYHQFESSQSKMKRIPVCKFIPTPVNGTKRYQSKDPETGEERHTPNNFIGTEITFDCADDLTLVGSGWRVCKENGMYSGSGVINECVATACGTLQTVKYGSITIKVNEGNSVASVTCEDGYVIKSESSGVHVCVNGEWSGGNSECRESGVMNVAIIAGITGGFVVILVVVTIAILRYCVFQYRKESTKTKAWKEIKVYTHSSSERLEYHMRDSEYD